MAALMAVDLLPALVKGKNHENSNIGGKQS